MFCRTCKTRAVSFGKQWQTTECDTAYKTIVSRPMVCVVASSNGLCGGIVQRWVCLHRPMVSVVASWRRSYWFSIFITGFNISITWFSISITKLLKNKCTLSKLPLHSQIDVGLKKKMNDSLFVQRPRFPSDQLQRPYISIPRQAHWRPARDKDLKRPPQRWNWNPQEVRAGGSSMRRRILH